MRDNPVVKVGNAVIFEFIFRSGDRERLPYIIVDDPLSDLDKGLISNKSPLARILLGEKTGSIIPYFTEELMAIEIKSIHQPVSSPQNMPDRRRKLIQDISSKITFREVLLFACSSDTKWGSYDPDALDYQSWKNERSDNDNDQS